MLSWKAQLWTHCICRALSALSVWLTLCRKAKAVELMLVDALLAADPVLKMTERIYDPREFIKMDDTLLKQVENYGMLHPGWESTEDHGPISEAQTIISRLVSAPGT